MICYRLLSSYVIMMHHLQIFGLFLKHVITYLHQFMLCYRHLSSSCEYLIMKSMIMMHHHHHFRNMSSLILNNSGYLIIIYHLHVIMMDHLHHFRNMSSLIFIIFKTCYHHLSSSCDYDASSSLFCPNM